MSLLLIIITFAVVGFVLWAINNFIQMDASVKKLLNIVVIIILVIWLLKATGILASLSSVTV